ncbi:DUF6090 family protein [Winogradskyella sp.]|uniref:DUF6090 family protein n=1 Tax=Winogradskyella sp. TaxID=1883156 RepID=UPI003F6C5DE3
MIKFFRHIRQSLLIENKTGKYFKYAIGEIILVVIGILIALQINTWNENRKEDLEESTILQNLHDEFSANKKLLKNTKLESNTAKEISYKVLSLFGKPKAYIVKNNPDSLLFFVLEPGEFRPSENTVNDLIQSGRLKLLKNKKLKDQLYKWQSALKDFDAQYKRVEIKIDKDIIPYLNKNYALKDIDKYGPLNWKEESTLKVNKYDIFNNIEFENILDDYLYRIISWEENIDNIEKIIEEILKETR